MITYEVNAIGVHPAILSVNRQSSLEASRIFYSENCFNFYTDGISVCTATATIIPFFEDRSEGSRRLINRIRFSYILSHFIYYSGPDRMFDEVCNYLSQKLQLEHVTLVFENRGRPRVLGRNAYEDRLSNLDKQIWMKQLVALVKNLDTFTITPKWAGQDDDLMRAAQTYLESKMEQASKLQEDTQDTDCTIASSITPS